MLQLWLSLLTNSKSPNAGGGGSCEVYANEYSHVT